MRLIINDDLDIYNVSEDAINLLKNCAVSIREYNSGDIRILPQKITLDEYLMNELFDEVFHRFKIRYYNAGNSFGLVIIK